MALKDSPTLIPNLEKFLGSSASFKIDFKAEFHIFKFKITHCPCLLCMCSKLINVLILPTRVQNYI